MAACEPTYLATIELRRYLGDLIDIAPCLTSLAARSRHAPAICIVYTGARVGASAVARRADPAAAEACDARDFASLVPCQGCGRAPQRSSRRGGKRRTGPVRLRAADTGQTPPHMWNDMIAVSLSAAVP